MIEKIKRTILIKKLELDCYNHIYQRAYKNNYLIVKRLDDEREYFKISQNQYEKYLILDQHTLETIKKQEQLLHEMKSFDDTVQLGYENKINEKTKILNQLEFEVFLLKKETKGIEKDLERKQLKQKKLKKQIKKYKNIFHQKYKIYFDDWNLYHYSNIRMYKIYSILNVKNLIDVIKEFKILQKKYNELSSLFALHNKEINNLKTTITEIDKEYKNILIEIENRKKNKEKKSEYHQVYITKIHELRFYNQIIRENYKDKSKTLKLILNFLLKHIETIINSLKNLSLKNNFTYNPNFKPQFGEKFLEKNSLSIHKDIDNMTLNSTFVIFVLSIFNNFANYFYLIVANSSNIVFHAHLLKLSKKNNKKNNDNEIIKEPILNKFMVFTLSSDSLIETLNDELNFANIKQLEKQKILSRTEKDIFKNQIKVKNIKNLKSISSTQFSFYNENNKTPLISKSDILKDYGLFLKNKNSNINNFSEHQNSYLSFINKFSNNLVNNGEDIKEIKRKKDIMNKTQLIKNLTYQRELIDFMKKKKKSFSDITNLEMNDDISEDEIEKYKIEQKKKIEEEIKESKKVKQFAMCSNNPEMILIYKRLNCLRQLNLHLVKDKNKFILDHDVFNSIYFNFKNKLLNQSKNQKKIINEKNNASLIKKKPINNRPKRNYSVIFKENKTNSIIKNIFSKTPIYSKDKSNNLNNSNGFLSTSRTGINSYYYSTKNNYNHIEYKNKRHRSLIDHHFTNFLDNNLNSGQENLSKNSNIEYDL